MKIDITQKNDNALLGRVELTGSVSFEGATPKRSDVVTQIASSLKTKPELVIVRKLESKYGGGVASVVAHAYKDKAVLERIEREYMRERNKLPEPEPAVEEEKTDSKEAAPEEKKEEKAQEEPEAKAQKDESSEESAGEEEKKDESNEEASKKKPEEGA